MTQPADPKPPTPTPPTEQRSEPGPRSEAQLYPWNQLTDDQKKAIRHIHDLLHGFVRIPLPEEPQPVDLLRLPQIDRHRPSNILLVEGGRGQRQDHGGAHAARAVVSCVTARIDRGRRFRRHRDRCAGGGAAARRPRRAPGTPRAAAHARPPAIARQCGAFAVASGAAGGRGAGPRRFGAASDRRGAVPAELGRRSGATSCPRARPGANSSRRSRQAGTATSRHAAQRSIQRPTQWSSSRRSCHGSTW